MILEQKLWSQLEFTEPLFSRTIKLSNSVVNPDSVGTETFSWIRNYFFRIRIRQKLKGN